MLGDFVISNKNAASFANLVNQVTVAAENPEWYL